MKTLLLTGIFTMFLASCGSDSNVKQARTEYSDHAKVAVAENEAEDNLICRRERRLGTNKITTVCRTKEEVDKTKEATTRDMQRYNHQTGSKSGN